MPRKTGLRDASSETSDFEFELWSRTHSGADLYRWD